MRALCIDATGSSHLCSGEFYDIEPDPGYPDLVIAKHDGIELGRFLASRFKTTEEAKPGRTSPCCGGLIPPGQLCAYHGV
jgi:hypothetical protein